MKGRRSATSVTLMVLTCVTLTIVSCTRTAQTSRTFATPEDAVRALIGAAKAGALEDVVAIFGPDGQELVDSSDPATARRNRDVFTVAAAEAWQLVDQDGGRKVLVVGNEGWPFPVPLIKVNSCHASAAATVNTSRLRRAVAGSEESTSSCPSGPKIATTSSSAPLGRPMTRASSGVAKVGDLCAVRVHETMVQA